MLSFYCIAGNIRGGNCCELVENTIFVAKTFANCSLLPCQRVPRPKFCRENFCKKAQNHEIHKRFLPRKFPTVQYFEHHHVGLCGCNDIHGRTVYRAETDRWKTDRKNEAEEKRRGSSCCRIETKPAAHRAIHSSMHWLTPQCITVRLTVL